MRNSVDITRGYQIKYMLGRTLFAAFLCLLIEIIVFVNFLDVEVLRTIVGVIMVFVYGIILYLGSSTLGKFDAKPYTPLKPQMIRPVIWGAIIAATSVIFLVMYKINWIILLKGDELPSALSLIINGLFYFWNSPYLAFFIGNKNGYISPIIEGVMILYPFVVCFLGYLAGIKNFSVIDKFTGFMFEKPNSEE